jgi:hypothetical protein
MDRFTSLVIDLLRSGIAVRFRARGWSMLPGLRDGDLVEARPCGADEISVGDVAIYRSGERIFAHRQIARQTLDGAREFLADGALSGEPEVIASNEVLGRVIPKWRPSNRLRRILKPLARFRRIVR